MSSIGARLLAIHGSSTLVPAAPQPWLLLNSSPSSNNFRPPPPRHSLRPPTATRSRRLASSSWAPRAAGSRTCRSSSAPCRGPDKPAAGKRFNEVKTAVEAAFAAAQDRAGLGRRRNRRNDSVRSHAARAAAAAGPFASAHADDRRAEGHHGPARLHRGRRARDRRRVAQLRGAEHSGLASGPRSAGEFLSGRRPASPPASRCCCAARPAPCRFA